MDNIVDAQELDCYANTYHVFKEFRSYLIDRIEKTENYVSSLPKHHQEFLCNYKNNFQKIKECLENNQKVLDMVLTGVSSMFQNVNAEYFNDIYQRSLNKVVEHEDVGKIISVLKQIYREWSKAGEAERNASYQPIIDELLFHFPRDKCDGKVKVLVPGAGLGRLAFNIARLGYECQGNEYSLYMLFASNFIFNRCRDVNQFSIHPWIIQFNNRMNVTDQLMTVSFPDVNPGDSKRFSNMQISMAAGDFVQVYKTENEWDCIATCFFIDCAQNVIEVIETIKKILKPGGIWVNLGPLMYHHSVIEDLTVTALSYTELKNIISLMGFKFEKEKINIETSYCQNPNSIQKNMYESVLFVCRKLQ